MQKADLVVVGAGLAGLTVARGAVAAGLDVMVIDKGRGVGGRLATRRAAGDLRFDHGAQYIRPKSAEFAAFGDAWRRAGALAVWAHVGNGLVGSPGMSGLPKALAADLQIVTGRRVGRLDRRDDRWTVFGTEGVAMASADRVVLACPAPQALMVLGADHSISAALRRVVFAPCWALMAAFEAPAALPESLRDDDPDAVLSWVAQDGAKPGRAGGATYVAHAATRWTRAHLEDSAETVCTRMLDALAARCDGALPPLRHAAAHRWRFSVAETPLGQPCIAIPEDGLFLCGDWCLGDRAEHAWLSATATLDAMALRAPLTLHPEG